MEEILKAVSTVGFPITITIYLLIERNTIVKAYTEKMGELVTKIEILIGTQINK